MDVEDAFPLGSGSKDGTCALLYDFNGPTDVDEIASWWDIWKSFDNVIFDQVSYLSPHDLEYYLPGLLLGIRDGDLRIAELVVDVLMRRIGNPIEKFDSDANFATAYSYSQRLAISRLIKSIQIARGLFDDDEVAMLIEKGLLQTA